MSTPNSDALPPEVQAEVAKALTDGEEPASVEPEETHEVRLSRRQQRHAEREEELRGAKERAESAERMAAELRQATEAQAARLSRMEQMLEGVGRMASQPVQAEPPKPKDVAEEVRRLERKATEALTKGDMDEYHRRMRKATRLEIEADLLPRIPNPQQFQAPPQMPQKPAWVSAVENQFPDVVTHQRGFDTVAAFIQLQGGGVGLDPDRLKKAFERTREELGLKQREQDQHERKRQMLAGGPTNGASRGGAVGGKSGTKVSIKLQGGLNPTEIARRAGMSVQDYAKAYAAMNPGDVEKE